MNIYSNYRKNFIDTIDSSDNDNDIEAEVACAWLKLKENTITSDNKKNWLSHKKHLLQLQGKPKLYIGGIFPLSGTKYKAPMLADGQL